MLDKIQHIDERIILWIGTIQSKRRNKIMKFFSKLGDKGIVWFAICAPLLIYLPTRLIGCNILVGLVLTHLCGEILIKHLVCRIRPCHMLEDEHQVIKKPKYYSFPSGHTASSFSVFAVTFFTFTIISIPIFILAFFIAFSRLYLRVHYLTDIIAGVILGTLCGVLAVELFKTILY